MAQGTHSEYDGLAAIDPDVLDPGSNGARPDSYPVTRDAPRHVAVLAGAVLEQRGDGSLARR